VIERIGKALRVLCTESVMCRKKLFVPKKAAKILRLFSEMSQK